MTIADEIRADMAKQAKNAVAHRCGTCQALMKLSPSEQDELDAIMKDRSYADASIARWLESHTDLTPRKESVGKHREGKHEYR